MPRKLARIIAVKVVHPILMAYLDTYAEDDEGPADSGKPGYDPRSTISGQYEVAANRDHDTPDVTVTRRFGFTSGRAK